jgi:prepilin-type N-terminal cleavage/methylation domain-containing protein
MAPLRLDRAGVMPRRAHPRSGFSLIELLIAMAVSGVVILGVITLVISENKQLSQAREMGDSWLTLRSAMEVLAYDLRQSSATGGDLSALSSTGFTVRAKLGSGVICATSANGYAVTDVGGAFTAGDSVQILSVTANPSWVLAKASTVGNPGTVGPAACAYDGSSPTSGVRLVSNPAGAAIGSLMQPFRSVAYGVVTSSGRSWLGRSVAGGSWEIVTGPLSSSGLSLTYYTAGGATTTTASDVAAVRITLRGESYGRTNLRQRMTDTVSVRVAVRN